VRTLAADLKIHPNTAHKVVQHLIQERFLEVRPGIGTVVADLPTARAGDRKRLLQEEVVELVVEAKRVGLDLSDVVEAIETQWANIDPSRPGNSEEAGRERFSQTTCGRNLDGTKPCAA
jgi:GntR family transcriptional regulator